MHIERVVITNFRCFGSTATTIHLGPSLTAFIGANGSGKTAVFQALLRLFGVTGEHRRVRRADFHVPADETSAPAERALSIEVVLGFPELAGDTSAPAVAAEFFRNVAATENGALKCRIRLDATWADDGSADGSVEEQRRVVTGFCDPVRDEQSVPLSAADRARVQVIYVPALRDAASQITTFLRGRLWRAINWSDDTRAAHEAAGSTLQAAFATEPAVRVVEDALAKRWHELHGDDAYARPYIRPIDARFGSFVRRGEIVFHPEGDGRDLVLEDLSDGQRSLLHLALVAAALDVERTVAEKGGTAFDVGAVVVPALTVVAVEEPENTLTAFYLTRIVEQLQSLSSGGRGQAIISSHSASVLSRVVPDTVRYFRLLPDAHTTAVRSIQLPDGNEDASKFVREAVRIFPELYFARFVVLGEGSTEEVVIPRLAAALGFPIDRSLVALVPLGGRHVNHLWRLLEDLDIPYATLLDLDRGRDGGGWGRINTAYRELLARGVDPARLLPGATTDDDVLRAVEQRAKDAGDDWGALAAELTELEAFEVFYCGPLDLDWEMLQAYPAAYMVAPPGGRGPTKGDARPAVFGEGGGGSLYFAENDEALRWYRYLFLTRGKPSTHSSVLLGLNDADLRKGMPPVLKRLLNRVAKALSVRTAEEA
jgi:putative ATP-dependent endonuclease of the OLD family